MNTQRPDQESTAELLAATLASEASTVETTPGALQEIQRRTRSTRSPRARWVWAVAGAGIATAAVVAGIVLVANNDSGGTTGAPIVDQPSEGDLTATYDVWFYGDQPDNPEGQGPGDPSVFAPLYLEQHIEDPTAGSLAEQAVRTFLMSGPFDPDYASGWPEGVDVEKVTTHDDLTTIALTGTVDLESRGDLNPGQTHSAIQSLLRTAGATGEASFTYNGEPLDRLLGQSVATPIEVLPYGPGTMDSLRAPISVDLTEGQSLTSPVTVPVTGNVFEGTVNWELLDQSGSVLDDGFVTAGTMEWAQVDIDLGALDPGSYTLRAFEVSVADGDETYADTKTFTVS